MDGCAGVTDRNGNGDRAEPLDGFADADEAYDYYASKLAEAES